MRKIRRRKRIRKRRRQMRKTSRKRRKEGNGLIERQGGREKRG